MSVFYRRLSRVSTLVPTAALLLAIIPAESAIMTIAAQRKSGQRALRQKPPAQETAFDHKAQLDREFKVKIGQEAVVDGLRIKFDFVSKDRRCPCEITCASHRIAEVILKLESQEGIARYVVLDTGVKLREAEARGYKIRLVKLAPCPEPNGDINRDEYEATLFVTESQTAIGRQGSSKWNFSGRWILREAVDAGRTIIVSHKGSRLVVTFEAFRHGRGFVTRTIYYIDGRTRFTSDVSWVEHNSKKQDYETSRVKSMVKREGDKLVIVRNDERAEWEMSESGQELILTRGKATVVYRRL